VSENNFPTAAGLASSAAGFACLVFALAKLFGLKDSAEELSRLARLGSGSACRSLFSGYVLWERGSRDDGFDSVARSVASSKHWPDMELLILVANDQQKTTSSTHGMKTSVLTSRLLTEYRAPIIVPERIRQMLQAIEQMDFTTFATLTMMDSNQFHAVCLDTYPPIFYLNEVSQKVIQLVTCYNEHYGDAKLAYTFDAGPNAVVLGMKPDLRCFMNLVYLAFFPPTATDVYRGFLEPHPFEEEEIHHLVSVLPQEGPIASWMKKHSTLVLSHTLKYMIHTKPGDGPCILYHN
jgi:diphosphomevalonate decarboxylase